MAKKVIDTVITPAVAVGMLSMAIPTGGGDATSLRTTQRAAVSLNVDFQHYGSTTTTLPPTSTTTRPRSLVAHGKSPSRVVVVLPLLNDSLLQRIGQCESGGDYTNYNRHSTASGKYMYLDSTWNNYGGYARAMQAPPALQEERAHADFARVGTAPWVASKACWG